MRLSDELSNIVVEEIFKEETDKNIEIQNSISKINKVETVILMTCSLLMTVFLILITLNIDAVRDSIFIVKGDYTKGLILHSYFTKFAVFVSPVVFMVLSMTYLQYKKEKILKKVFTIETKTRNLKKALLNLIKPENTNEVLKEESFNILKIIDDEKSLIKLVTKSFVFRDYRRLEIKLFQFINKSIKNLNVKNKQIESKSLKIDENIDLIKNELSVK